MALTDRVMEHGRDLDGLAPSTYEATLAFNLADGYPVGVFLPARRRPGPRRHRRRLADPAVHGLARRRCSRSASGARPAADRGRRHCGRRSPFVAAQSALLFGYYLWGGIKEVAAAALIAALPALAAGPRSPTGSPGAR